MENRRPEPQQFETFLLYNSREADRAERVYKALVERGIRPYFDRYDLPAGAAWQEFEEDILSVEPLIILLLGAAGWGPNHRRIAIEANAQRLRIIPVLIGDPGEEALNDAGAIFVRRQRISVESLDETAFDVLAEAIRKALARSVPPRAAVKVKPGAANASGETVATGSTAPPDLTSNAAPSPPRVAAKSKSSAAEPLEESVATGSQAPPDLTSNAAPLPPSPPPLAAAAERVDLEITSRAVSELSGIDLLGFGDYAEALADFIKNEQTQKPITIGIEAPWGMGKTRLMRMIRDRLFTLDEAGRRSDIPTVWFDAWKYDKEESLWAALALEVLSQTRRSLSIRRWLIFWTALNWRRVDRTMLARSVLNLGIYTVLFGLALMLAILLLTNFTVGTVTAVYLQKVGLAAAGGALLKALYGMHKRLAIPFDEKIARYVRQPKYDERVGFIARFQEDFREVVKVVTETAGHPLVIFIDDLDRCTPAKAVEVLEAINLLLDSEDCVFVIGMDAKAVTASIEAKYKDVVALMKASDDPGGLTLGQKFLEKILQIEFRLPPPSDEHMAGYVEAILGAAPRKTADPVALKRQALQAKATISKEEQKGKSLDEAAASERLASVPEKVVMEAKAERFAESFDSYDVVRDAVQSAARFLYNNPRKVKRFVNAFRLQALIANRRKLLEEKVIDLELLALWLVAETRWPDLMNDILSDSTLLDRASFAKEMKTKYNDDPSNDNLRRLEVATSDPRVKRLAEANEAAPVLTELRRRAGDRLEDYLHLGRIVAHVVAPAASSAAQA